MMMRGKVVMVTGANGGMGKVIARELARQEATVVMVARDPGRGDEARREIVQATGNRSVDLLIADLSSQQSIRDLARQFRERYSRLHVLVNNVGAHIQQRKLSVDGIEMNLAVNHLSAFLLSNLLLDTLRASAPARIVNVASQAMADARPVTLVGKPRPATIDFDDLQSEREFVPFEVYGRAKLAMLLCTYALARRLAGTGVTANALHPGMAATNIINDVSPPLVRPFLGLIKPFLPTPEQSARTALYLATSPAVEGVSGRYFIREKETPSVPISYDEALQERMWAISEQLTGLRSRHHASCTVKACGFVQCAVDLGSRGTEMGVAGKTFTMGASSMSRPCGVPFAPAGYDRRPLRAFGHQDRGKHRRTRCITSNRRPLVAGAHLPETPKGAGHG